MPIDSYRGRALVNARLKTFLDRLEIGGDGVVTYRFKPEYEGVTDKMLELYAPAPD